MPFPRAETTPPVTKMNGTGCRARSGGIQSLGGIECNGDSTRWRKRARSRRPPAARFACFRAAPSELSAPSIRISSSTTPSAVELLHGGERGVFGGRLLDPEVAAGERGDLGQVGDAEHLARPRPAPAGARPRRGPSGRRRRRRPRRTRECATRPFPATVISASITRDSSPPDAASRMGAAGTPGFGASISSTRSAPVGPISSRGSSRTSNEAPSIASATSSSRTRSASRGAASRRRSPSCAASSPRSARARGKPGLGALGGDLGLLEPLALGAAALRVREHRRDAAAVLALEPVVQLEPLLDFLRGGPARPRGESP